MFCLIYLSEALTPFDDNSLNELVLRANDKNKRLGITGFLHKSNNEFVQYLEGQQNCVEDLYQVIKEDDRHDIKFAKTSNEVPYRRFPKWNMRQVLPSPWEVTLESILKDHLSHSMRISQFGLGKQANQLTWSIVERLAKG